MNQALSDAITATRANNKREAQLLLAANLKENPDDVQSWYLLSMLVDSKEKQALYLGKALALDPAHPKAQERLTRLQTAETIAISDEPLDFLAQSEGDTLPEWLAGDVGALQLEKMGMRAAPGVVEEVGTEEAGVTAVATAPAKDVPDWLQQDVNSTWVTQEPPTQVSPFPAEKEAPSKTKPQPAPAAKAKPAPRKKPAAKKPRTKKQKASQLNLVMGVLVIFFMLIALYLVYLVVTQQLGN
ncbi:MAG: hypothetical protein KJ069_09875 [Anaerolineae bacterium]|nr:hypothetical protein [Anaerolineae bacterium]